MLQPALSRLDKNRGKSLKELTNHFRFNNTPFLKTTGPIQLFTESLRGKKLKYLSVFQFGEKKTKQKHPFIEKGNEELIER